MSWTLKGKSQTDKVQISGAEEGVQMGAWDGTSMYQTGYSPSTGESYYRVRNGICDVSVVFPSTNMPPALTSSPAVWCIWASSAWLPKPKDLSSKWRIYGYANHINFGGYGSDFLMQYDHNLLGSDYIAFEFLVANQGTYQSLNSDNYYQFIHQFFGTYGSISVNLEYDI